MKAALIVLIATALTGGASQSPKSSDDQPAIRELENIEHKLAEAWLKGDREFVERTLAEDWTVTDASGRVLTRRQVIDEGFISHERRVISATVDELRVRMAIPLWSPANRNSRESIAARVPEWWLASSTCLFVAERRGRL